MRRLEKCLGSFTLTSGREFHAHVIAEEGTTSAALKIEFEGPPPNEAECNEAASLVTNALGATYGGALNVGSLASSPEEADALVNDFFKHGASRAAGDEREKKREIN